MSPVRGDLAPTARLRWVERATTADAPMNDAVIREIRGDRATDKILQQWWAADVPSYMRATAEGEWRDVPAGVEAP